VPTPAVPSWIKKSGYRDHSDDWGSSADPSVTVSPPLGSSRGGPRSTDVTGSCNWTADSESAARQVAQARRAMGAICRGDLVWASFSLSRLWSIRTCSAGAVSWHTRLPSVPQCARGTMDCPSAPGRSKCLQARADGLRSSTIPHFGSDHRAFLSNTPATLVCRAIRMHRKRIGDTCGRTRA